MEEIYQLYTATNSNISDIMQIIEGARENLKKQGLSQWQAKDDAPSMQEFQHNIQQQKTYVYKNNLNQIVAIANISGEKDPVYEALQSWNKPLFNNYASIHRFAVVKDQGGKGIATQFLNALIQEAEALGFKDIRIDTHPNNITMQKVIKKNDFNYCGIVEFPICDGNRFAYQRILNN